LCVWESYFSDVQQSALECWFSRLLLCSSEHLGRRDGSAVEFCLWTLQKDVDMVVKMTLTLHTVTAKCHRGSGPWAGRLCLPPASI
jgi:hypothetical protein